MTRIRVLEIGKSTAGIGTYMRWLAQGLDVERFQLMFACLSERGTELARELKSLKGINSISWPMNRFKVDVISDLVLTLRIARLIRSEKFDLVHAHGSKAGFLTRLAAVGSGVPVIYSPHCFSFHAGVPPLTANFLAMVERFFAKYLTVRIVTVANGEQTLAQHYRVGIPKLFVNVYSGIDPSLYDKPIKMVLQNSSLKFDENTLLVGAVGRLGEQKSPLDFVKMAALVHKQMPQAHFVWAGSGPLDELTRELSKKLDIDSVCHFIGEYNDIPSLLANLDCFVLPSLWEGFPIVLLEAMAAGVPIVATNILGNDEAIISGKNGWLVPPGNPAALAEKVLSILADPDKSAMLAEFGRKRISHEFTRTKMLESIQNVYQGVVDETKNK